MAAMPGLLALLALLLTVAAAFAGIAASAGNNPPDGPPDLPAMLSRADATAVPSGATIIFSANNLSQDDLILEWRASLGSPLRSSGSTLRWTAPVVDSAQAAAIILSLTSPAGCSRTDVIDLLVVPRSSASIRLEKGCRYEPPARIGDRVLYTYNITNTGNLPLFDVNLTDTQNWGPGCRPVYVSGDGGDGILDSGELWRYECRYTIADPDDYLRLQIMQSSGRKADLAGIVERLLEMKDRLEIMMESLRRTEGEFDRQRATLMVSRESISGESFTNYSYRNEVTGESYRIIMDGRGSINRSIYFDPVTGAELTRVMSASGKTISEEICYPPPGTGEYLKVEYDLPVAGYRTYTIIDFKSGDTLVLTEDSQGEILSREYRITPGYKPYEETYILKNTATVNARTGEGVQVEDHDSFALKVLRPMPVLTIVKVPEEVTADPDEILNYTINYQNIGHADAHDVVVTETYDEKLSFLWADPPPDPGTDNLWTFGDLKAGEWGSIRVRTRVSSDALPGTHIVNKVEVALDTASLAMSVVNTTISGPALNISKRASPEVIGPDETFTYIISYSNDGQHSQDNVTINDWLDPNVDFVSLSATPPRDFSISGGHLVWQCGRLDPGDGGTIEIKVKASSGSSAPLINRYSIGSSGEQGAVRTLETLVEDALWINKTADKKSYNADENITYTIKYGNARSQMAWNVNVTDLMPDVDLVGASPPPYSENGKILTWSVGALRGGETKTITLTVHIPRRAAAGFLESSSVQGEGYVYSRKDISTGEKREALTNTAHIWGYYDQPGPLYNDSSRATVSIAGYAGTMISSVEHGSGRYEEDSESCLNQENKSVSLNKDIFATYKSTEFALPKNRSLNFDSAWSDRTRAENMILGDVISEQYFYAGIIDRNSSFHADMNETVYASDGDFTSALARISYKKHPSGSATAQEIDENYHGSFRVREGLDSYGESVKFSKTAVGKGFVSSDRMAAGEQRSYESGSGYYSSEEEEQLGSVEKDIKALHAPTVGPAGKRNISYADLWSEGLWTAEEEKGIFVGERLSQAVSMDREEAMEETSLSMLGQFNGTQEIAVQAGPKMGVQQTFQGSFETDTAVSIYSAPRHLYPHVNVSQNATMLDEETALFWINVTNDGNRKLGRINVTDILPQGLEYINSSVRPKASGRMINWSIPSLDIGRTISLKLRARINGSSAFYVNSVRVRTVYEESVLQAESRVVLEAVYQPLPCCPAGNATAYNASAIFKSAVVKDNWGDWNPSPCFGINGSMTECSALRDEYYDELERNMTQCCASNYEVP